MDAENRNSLAVLSLIFGSTLPNDDLIKAINERSYEDKMYMLLTCSARIIEFALGELSDHDLDNALEGLDALTRDMRNNITKQCDGTDGKYSDFRGCD